MMLKLEAEKKPTFYIYFFLIEVQRVEVGLQSLSLPGAQPPAQPPVSGPSAPPSLSPGFPPTSEEGGEEVGGTS